MARRKNSHDDTPPPVDGDEPPARTHNIAGIDGAKLRSFIERVERLEEEKRATATDIKEVYAEAKGAGFDTKTIRALVKERRMDKDDLDEQQTLLEIYKHALGMFVDTPLGAAAMATVQPKRAAVNEVARQAGRTDGMAGERTHEAEWPNGQYGAADYELGFDEGVAQRERASSAFTN